MALPRVAQAMTDAGFERLARDDPAGRWELWDGVARSKPLMTSEHNEVADTLAYELRRQLDRQARRVRSEKGRVRRPRLGFFIPDVFAIPAHLFAARRAQPDRLQAYSEPLPLVIEVWSPSTGRYDVTDKLAEYPRRGDAEIWLVHPYERTLRAWRRQADGTYHETRYTSGPVSPASLPGVTITLDTLFD